MPYADSDFFLALIKKSDWLKAKAETALEKYSGNIWTSEWAVVEILLISKEFGLDPENVVVAIKELARIEGNVDKIISAAHLMKEKGLNTFDALHAVSCKNDEIISSEHVYDKLGLKRINICGLKAAVFLHEWK